MSVDERIDAIDLIFNALKAHEKKLSKIVNKSKWKTMVSIRFFNWCRNYSNRVWKQIGHKWTPWEQEQKMKEEMNEFLLATKGQGPHDICDEFWDCFFANLTMIHILPGVTDECVLRSFKRTLTKLETRIAKKYFGQEEK